MTYTALIAAIEDATDLDVIGAKNIKARNTGTVTIPEFVCVRRAIRDEKAIRFQNWQAARADDATLLAHDARMRARA